MTITRDATAPLPGSPTKNDIVSVAHTLADAADCPFEHIHFSYIDHHGTHLTCSGFDFTRNFIDRAYQSAFVSVHWPHGGGHIDVTIAPTRYCALHITSSRHTEAELTDLFAAIGEQLTAVLSSDQPPNQDADKQLEQPRKKHLIHRVKEKVRNGFKQLVRKISGPAFLKLLEYLLDKAWPPIISAFRHVVSLIRIFLGF